MLNQNSNVSSSSTRSWIADASPVTLAVPAAIRSGTLACPVITLLRSLRLIVSVASGLVALGSAAR